MRVFCTIFAAIALVACAQPSPLPNMESGETGRVVRVIDGDAIALNTGQSVRLVGIEAPALRPRGRDPDAYAVEASRALEDMVLGRGVRLYYSGLTRDRYDRALAHIITTDGAGPELWVNMELVKQGAARVRLYPDTAARGAELLAAEAQARRDNIGLWQKTAYKVPTPDQLPQDWRGFTLVTATLGARLEPQGRFSARQACHRQLIGVVLVVEVRWEAARLCEMPEGTSLRLRGWVSDQRLDLTLPLHAELLDQDELSD